MLMLFSQPQSLYGMGETMLKVEVGREPVELHVAGVLIVGADAVFGMEIWVGI